MMDRATLEGQLQALIAESVVLTDPAYEDAAPETARIIAGVLRELAKEAHADCWARGIDPTDRAQLAHYADQNSAIAFVWKCRCAATAFDNWRAIGDYRGTLGAVYAAGVEWLADNSHTQMGGDTVRHNLDAMGEHVQAARARAATAEMTQRGQQSGNTRRESDAKTRARAAWAILGNPPAKPPSLLARVAKASPAQLQALADLYARDNGAAFAAEAKEPDSRLRVMLRDDWGRIKTF